MGFYCTYYHCHHWLLLLHRRTDWNRATKECIKKTWGSFAKCCWGWNLECLLCCDINFFSCFVMLGALSPKHEPFIQCIHISSNNSCPVINHLPWVIAPLWQKYLNSRLRQIITPPPPPLTIFVFFYSLPVKLKVDTSNNKQAFIWLFDCIGFVTVFSMVMFMYFTFSFIPWSSREIKQNNSVTTSSEQYLK